MTIDRKKLCKKCRAAIKRADAEYMRKYRQNKKVETKT
jgi:hypothetical protein